MGDIFVSKFHPQWLVCYDLIFTQNTLFFMTARNLLDQRYYAVNLGASPESALGGRAAHAEFANGASQNPFRLMGCSRVKF